MKSVAFKDKLREIRLKRKLSQEKLAEMLGTKQSYISSWEHGKYEPRIETLKEIAHALNCTVSELVGNGRKT
jgi:transcriptional regulator with XRE-family HTH domain